jgi:hypothetical protein
MKKSMILPMSVIIAVAVTGCFSMPETGGSNQGTTPSITLGGTSWESKISVFGMKQLITFVDDINVIDNALGTEHKGTYTVKGNIITITYPDSKNKDVYTIKGDVLKTKNNDEFVKK